MENLFGEFMGMVVLVTFGCGGCANMALNKTCGHGGGWICITAGWALAVLLGVFTASALGAPQADINPSVTLAKTLAGIYTFPQFLATAVAQIAGGFIGGVVVYLAYLPQWKETEDGPAKRGVFCTAPVVRNIPAAFLTEMIATFFLMFVIWMIFAKPNGPLPPGLGPYFVAMLIWALGLSLGGPTGYAMSASRDLGPRLAHAVLPIPNKADSDWGYAWVPVIAPLCGGALAYAAAHLLGMV